MAGIRKAARHSHTQNETTQPSQKHTSSSRNFLTQKIHRVWTLTLSTSMSESFNTKNIIGMDHNSTKNKERWCVWCVCCLCQCCGDGCRDIAAVAFNWCVDQCLVGE